MTYRQDQKRTRLDSFFYLTEEKKKFLLDTSGLFETNIQTRKLRSIKQLRLLINCE